MDIIDRIYGCNNDRISCSNINSEEDCCNCCQSSFNPCNSGCQNSCHSCCNSNTGCGNNCCGNNCCSNNNPIENCFDTIKDELCDMKASIGECKSVLAFLAQSICNENGFITEQEKQLLLLMEGKLNALTRDVACTRKNVDCLENLVTC